MNEQQIVDLLYERRLTVTWALISDPSSSFHALMNNQQTITNTTLSPRMEPEKFLTISLFLKKHFKPALHLHFHHRLRRRA